MRTTNKVNKMKNEKAVMPMRSVNANPGKYVSIITNFGCHYTCPECIVRNNGLKMSETDNFSTQEPLNKVLCKERPEWVSVSGGGDPLFHWKDHWSFYEGLFHTAERRNVKLEMHTSYSRIARKCKTSRLIGLNGWCTTSINSTICSTLKESSVR